MQKGFHDLDQVTIARFATNGKNGNGDICMQTDGENGEIVPHSGATISPRPEKKHRLPTRLWHWTNALAIIIMFMSGLNIFNAHPRLYWGSYGSYPDSPWLHLDRFPAWMTIPGYYSLADARLWHFFFAWVLSLSLLAFLVISLFNRHLQRDVHITRREWRWSTIWTDIKEHARLNFDHGSGKYNVLQKLTYALVLFVLIPLMILTGITMSPAMDANWGFLLDIFGGRQSARSIHFIVTALLFGFFIVHILLVLLAGPIGQMRDMITGGSTKTRQDDVPDKART